MPGKETVSGEIIFLLSRQLCGVNTKLPILKGVFKSYLYSRTKNLFKKNGLDRNILS